MSIILEKKIGESLSVGFLFNEAFSMARLESVKVYIGSKLYTHTVIGHMVRCELKSTDTAKLGGITPVSLWIDDSVIGVDKISCGELKFVTTNATSSNDSINTGYDLVMPITISEQTVTIGDIMYNYVKGADGEVTSDSIDAAITDDYTASEATETDYVVGQGKKKFSFASIFNFIKSALGISSSGNEDKFMNQKGEFKAMAIGGGFSAPLYYTSVASEIIANFKQLNYTPQGAETVIQHTVTTTETKIATYIYDNPIATSVIDAGNWQSSVVGKVSSTAGDTRVRLRFFMYKGGVETELFSQTSDEINNTNYATIVKEIPKGVFTVDPAAHLAVDIFISTTGANKTITFKTGGDNPSYIRTPLRSRHDGLRDLNGNSNYQHITSVEKGHIWNTPEWQTGYNYRIGNTFTVGQTQYKAILDHTSSTIESDLASNKIISIGGGGSSTGYKLAISKIGTNGITPIQIFKDLNNDLTISSVSLMSNCSGLLVTIKGNQFNQTTLIGQTLSANNEMIINDLFLVVGNTSANAIINFEI